MPPHIMATTDAVTVGKAGRCYCQYNLEEFGSLSLTSSEWREVKVMHLITEIIHVMDAALELQINEIAWLREDRQQTGGVHPPIHVGCHLCKACDVLPSFGCCVNGDP